MTRSALVSQVSRIGLAAGAGWLLAAPAFAGLLLNNPPPQPLPHVTVPYPSGSPGRGVGRGVGGGARAGAAKLSPELQLLAGRYGPGRGVSRGPGAGGPSDELAHAFFGARAGDPDPTLYVAVTLAPGARAAALTADGARTLFRVGRVAYAAVPARGLGRLAADPAVTRVEASLAARDTPLLPSGGGGGASRGPTTVPMNFDHQGLTGKGVIVGVVDSGIDWHHADFRKADGSTRILAIWDMFDDSYAASHGTVGSKPPVEGLGTLYTQAQINAALSGHGTVNTGDTFGHGTACAGTAAGNGRAPGHFPGVAPDADLVIVRTSRPEDGDGIEPTSTLGVRWIAQMAQARHEPCVVSMSFGTQTSPHDGSAPDERAINSLTGPGRKGLVLCAAAGNEGGDSLHYAGLFGPRRPGEADVHGRPVDLFVNRQTVLIGYFHHSDDWSFSLLSSLVTDGSGQPAPIYVRPTADRADLAVTAPDSPDPSTLPKAVQAAVHAGGAGGDDTLLLLLSPGVYNVGGYGADGHVSSGRYDLYLPEPDKAVFGNGASQRAMIGSPGNASGVLTVGAYITRSAWTSQAGPVAFNLPDGDAAPFSSPGFRRDGLTKPDLCAPGQFAISPLSPGAAMVAGPDGTPDPHEITPDGQHVVWAGTSAATPYTAGVVALMLQKDPALDQAQAQRLLTRTTTRDAFVGAVPNVQWGYGKLNPVAALKATP